MEIKITCIDSPKVSSYRVIWHQGQCLMSYKSQLNSKILWRVYSLSVQWGRFDKILFNIISISFQCVFQVQCKLQPFFSTWSQNLWIFARQRLINWLGQPAEDDRRDSRSTASNDLAKTLHLQWSWQTKDELHKINMSHIVRLLTAANKRVSAYTRSDQDFIKKTWRMVENVKSTDYEAKGRARDLPQPSIFHLKDLSLHALHCTGR